MVTPLYTLAALSLVGVTAWSVLAVISAVIKQVRKKRMQTKQNIIEERARIVYDGMRDTFAVRIGVAFVHFGSLFSCEQWCRERGIPVKNQQEINRIKYHNMPVQEMF